MDLGDKIYLYENGNKYEYIFSDNYEIKKNGYADIYTDNTRKSIALVTCKEESNDAQVVYIGYLINTSSYLKEQ
jgi:sortase (surface protein transpeptidase)